MNANPTTRFSNRVAYYTRYRPRYPKELLEFFESDLGLPSTDPVADIGSGTGILTELLLTNGNPVFAVEPNQAMRQQAEMSLQRFDRFQSIGAPAESTTLGDQSVAMITVAQAFHWFDPKLVRPEFSRILRTGGWVCLVWNERRLHSPFGEAYHRLSSEFTADAHIEHHRTLTADGFQPIRDFFAPAPVKVAEFDNHQLLDREGLIGRVLSNSNSPLEGHPLHSPMIRRLNGLFDEFQVGGYVRFDYDTRVYHGRLS